MRFYDLQSGKIEIDGQNIAEVSQESLRQAIGMVTQDTSLLHRSIRENIVFGRPDAGDAEILEAARTAEALSFIEGLSDQRGRKGLDAHVGDRGVKLSGGQRQRIAIAPGSCSRMRPSWSWTRRHRRSIRKSRRRSRRTWTN